MLGKASSLRACKESNILNESKAFHFRWKQPNAYKTGGKNVYVKIKVFVAPFHRY